MEDFEADAIEVELDELLAEPLRALPKLDGMLTGRLAGFDGEGRALVEFPGNPAGGPVTARTLVSLAADAAGADVALVFEGQDSSRPVVLGVLRERALAEAEPAQERVEIRAQREIVLRVGRSSITLTDDGKVLIRGAYVLSRSSGVNRIKGGSVHLN